MARAKIPITVLGSDGRPLAGATVTVRKRSDQSNATVYSAETGGGTLANPLTSDASGRVGGWLDRGAFEAVISGTGITTYIEPVDAAPASDQGIDTGWLADDAASGPKVADSALPIGVLVPFAGAASPNSDWLLCDGSAYSRATYAELFARIGTSYGAGDGSTTFNVPDTRGRPLYGKGTHADVDTLGKSDGVAVASRKPKHQHGKGTLAIPAGGGSHGHNIAGFSGGEHAGSDGSITVYFQGGGGNVDNPWVGISTHAHPSSEFSGAVGDTTSALVDSSPYLVVNHLIRAR